MSQSEEIELTRDYVARHRFPPEPTQELWDELTGSIHRILEQVEEFLGDRHERAITIPLQITPWQIDCCVELTCPVGEIAATEPRKLAPNSPILHIPCGERR